MRVKNKNNFRIDEKNYDFLVQYAIMSQKENSLFQRDIGIYIKKIRAISNYLRIDKRHQTE